MKRIEESFAQLRREEEAAVPPFTQVMQRRVRARRVASRFAVAFAAIVLLVTALLIVRREHERPQSYAFPQWKAPTDFLLETPGTELTRDVPAIGMTEIPKGVVR